MHHIVAHGAVVLRGSNIGHNTCRSHTHLCQDRQQLFLKQCASLATACRQLVCRLLHPGQNLVHLLHQATDTIVQTVGLLQTAVKVVLDIKQRADIVHPVLLLQAVDKVETLIHLCLPFGRILNPVIQRGHLRKDVLHLYKTGIKSFVQRLNAIVESRDLREGTARSRKPRHNAVALLSEAPYRIELVGHAGRLTQGVARLGKDAKILEQIEPAYRDYVVDLDRKEAIALLEFYRQRADKQDYLENLGEGFEDFETLDIPAYVNHLFDESVLTSYEKVAEVVNAGEWEKFGNDPAILLFNSIMTEVMARYPVMLAPADDIDAGSKAFTAGLMEWEKGKPSYPDANSTMRLTYGHVMPYSPKDAVLYKHYSTVKGVLEKEDPENPEFIVPAKLKSLIEAKDFGRYADASDGLVHTCFLTNNDITGGNSGSPVLNAKGELIGLAFDGNWESMSSDVMFEPDLQRCICVDIRYVLFLVEKLGGATNIINEIDFAK